MDGREETDTWQRDGFTISDEKERIDGDVVHRYLECSIARATTSRGMPGDQYERSR